MLGVSIFLPADVGVDGNNGGLKRDLINGEREVLVGWGHERGVERATDWNTLG